MELEKIEKLLNENDNCYVMKIDNDTLKILKKKFNIKIKPASDNVGVILEIEK